ncbi:hypothetical protein [Methylobacterium radiodurans]|uniref:Uncharacterized protein n=1 Tax=Methylobacterium radiodurans TaxID=2202828 RepID=A0A2U8VVG8_9HYPH|nr:hypothetical protein [Methylobacterium radiodurans]AWN37705.1 hypothetical protein DK427_19865 [Methylobacterium radiodurans]
MVIVFHSKDCSSFWSALMVANGLTLAGRRPAIVVEAGVVPVDVAARPTARGMRVVRVPARFLRRRVLAIFGRDRHDDVLVALRSPDAARDLDAIAMPTAYVDPVRGAPEADADPRSRIHALASRIEGPGPEIGSGMIASIGVPRPGRLCQADLLKGRPGEPLLHRSLLLTTDVLAAACSGIGPGDASGRWVQVEECLRVVGRRLQARARAGGGRFRDDAARRRPRCRSLTRPPAPETCRKRVGEFAVDRSLRIGRQLGA